MVFGFHPTNGVSFRDAKFCAQAEKDVEISATVPTSPFLCPAYMDHSFDRFRQG